MSTTDETREYYTLNEVARELRITYRTAWTWTHEKKLPAVRVGRFIRIPASALEQFIKPVA